MPGNVLSAMSSHGKAAVWNGIFVHLSMQEINRIVGRNEEEEVIPLFRKYEWKVLEGLFQFMRFSKWLDLNERGKKKTSSSTGDNMNFIL